MKKPAGNHEPSEPADAFVDLGRGREREREAGRLLAAAVEEEVGALDEGDLLFARAREERLRLDARGQVEPEEIAALGVVPARVLGHVAGERRDHRVAPHTKAFAHGLEVGPEAAAGQEFEQRRREVMHDFYLGLGEVWIKDRVRRRKRTSFWAFQEEHLAEIGARIEPRLLARGIGAALLKMLGNPGDTLRKIRRKARARLDRP